MIAQRRLPADKYSFTAAACTILGALHDSKGCRCRYCHIIGILLCKGLKPIGKHTGLYDPNTAEEVPGVMVTVL